MALFMELKICGLLFLGHCFLRAEIAHDGWGSILFLRGQPSLFFADMLPAVATAFL
jgi:hypothetical protein